MDSQIVRKQLDPEVADPSHQQQHSYSFMIEHEDVINLNCPQDTPTYDSYSPLSPPLAWVHITRPTTFQTWWYYHYTPYSMLTSAKTPYAPWLPWPRLCWFTAAPTYDEAGNITNFTWDMEQGNPSIFPNEWGGINGTLEYSWNGAHEFYHTLDKQTPLGDALNGMYISAAPMFHVEPGWYHVHAQFGPSKCLHGLAHMKVFHLTHSFGRDATAIADVNFTDFPTEEDPNKVVAGIPNSDDLELVESEFVAGGYPGNG